MISIQAQLPDGSDAPDFMATDIYGDTHHLNEYLEDGYTVILKFSATWCGICWNYHNSGALTNTWNQYGPQGLNEAIVLFIEGDVNTSVDCLYGNCTGTQGNWTMMTPYPIINSHLMNEPYEISGYPTVIGIHPNGKTRSLGQASAEELEDFIIEARFLGYSSSVTQISCVGASDGSIHVMPDEDGFSIMWNNGSTDSIITNLSPGIYKATISDGAGTMILTEDFQIVEPEPMILNTISLQNIDCDNPIGGAAVLASGGNGGYEYVWSNGQNGNQLIAFNPGAYMISATDSIGCIAIEEIIIEKNSEMPEIDAGNDIEVPCDVSWPLILESNSDNPHLIYLWSHENGPLEGDADGSSVLVETTGVFRVSVIDTMTGCENFDEVSVDYVEIEESFITSDVSCKGSETGMIELIYDTEITQEIIWSNGSMGNLLENIAAGNYHAAVMIGECTRSFSVEIEEPTLAFEMELVTLLISDGTEGILEVSISGGWGDYSIEWFYEGDLIASDENMIMVDQTGKYEVEVADAGGCVLSEMVFMDFTTGLRSSILKESISIYPNPTENTLKMETSKTLEIEKIEIFDLSGRRFEAGIKSDDSINVSELSPGQYFLKVMYKSGEIGVGKFVKVGQ